MLNILFATTNHGKLLRYKKYYADSDYRFYSCAELGLNLPDVMDDESTEEENAIKKAVAFHNILLKSDVELPKGKWVVVSVDTGLYFEKVHKLEQPGCHIKRIAGAGVFKETKEETFSKMATFYSSLAKKYGGEIEGCFKDVFCIFDGQKSMTVRAKRSITLTDTMHTKDLLFPVGSFFKVKGQYFHELTDQEYTEYLKPSFQALDKLLGEI